MKFSTIGTSWITEAFIAAAKKSGAAELHAVYSRTEEKAKTFAEKNGAKQWFSNLEAMLEDKESEFIYIASPNLMHYEHMIMCIENEKHVFCEKPMVLNESQWKHVQETAKKKGVFVFEGFRHLFSPNYMKLKDHLPQLGQVRSVMLQYVQYSSKYDAFKDGKEPNVFSKEFAGGALMDLGVYPLSMALDLFGEPEDINYSPVLLSNGVDGSGTLVLTYNDFIVTILCSKVAQGTIPSEIHGEDGALRMDHVAPIEQLSFYDRKTKETTELAEKQEQLDMIYEAQAFVKMVKEQNHQKYEAFLERSRWVAKWTAKARQQHDLLFPGE
ncbi:Gfo/Idh/MocA family protein [Oceanobacillus manasiensis]|uniref:Gfo/Idh/MocA family protein n=1 Tax=Oceanobacillus manasiensis TaxID=586413 RepID=UPI0005AB12BE|nr:Gfo/Idh/MocA family oxidoreductase [Oceanobacillus manasiensis]